MGSPWTLPSRRHPLDKALGRPRGLQSRASHLCPSLITGENIVILGAAARLGHHLRHSVAPGLTVGCLFMPARIRLGAINLD